MSAPIKFAVHPEEVTSKYDRQRHFIGVPALVHLYGLRPSEYVVWDERRPETHRGRRWNDYLHLFPLYEGNYEEHIAHLRDAIGVGRLDPQKGKR